jgi:16S rRNA (cytosine967-C5)-methyltransferase
MAKDPEKAISVLHSHPRWLVERWLDEFGIDETLAICRANNTLPPVALRVNSLKASREQACAALEREGMTAQPTVFSPDGIILTSPAARLRETIAFRDGLIRVQDEASQLIARLTDPQPGERLLDLCAGAGGKTLHLAALMENRGSITAVDHQSEKLRLLREEAGRLGVTIVETQTADALAPPETFRGIFDRVLLDAPCSALGTLRRNPEIRWRLAPADIEKCSQIQRRLLRSAADCVRPGGRLIYSVCAVTPEENEAVIEDLLNSRTDFSLIKPPIAGGIPHELIDAAGFFRTSPHRHGTDGFFAALFIRNA